MSNKSTIKCPNCNTEFDATDAFRAELEKELNLKAKDWQEKKEADFKKDKEDALKKQAVELEENLRKNITNDVEAKMKFLAESNQKLDKKLKDSQQKELDFLRREKALKDEKSEMEVVMQKKINEASESITEIVKKQEQEKNSLKIKELEKQLEDQKKLAEEMTRKAEQGSMQLQGEVMELALEELLKIAFPFDEINEVGKGVKGADCIQVVRNNIGQECGKIIYESKRTKAFSNEWIEKLKTDMRSTNAVTAVLVTDVLPKGIELFGEKDGIWICRFSEVKLVSSILRDGIIKIASATRSQGNKGEKMTMLYDYLTGNEFSEQWKAIREGFMSMKLSIQKERDTMEKLWKAREKHLEKVLLNAAYIKGSVEGIAGQESIDLSLDTNDDLLIE